jgi:hypothetical protein
VLPPGAIGLEKEAGEVRGVRFPVASAESEAEDDEVVAAGGGADAVEVLGRQAAQDLLHYDVTKAIHPLALNADGL